MAIIDGSTGNDVLTGTADGDTITGLGGSDTLQGAAGNDNLIGDGLTATGLTPVGEFYLNVQANSLANGLGGASGFGENQLARIDDVPSTTVNITSVFGQNGLNYFGRTFTSLYINNNGNITFAAPSGQFTPDVISGGANNPIIAPFWADVDTRGGVATATPGGASTGTNLVYYDLDTVNRVFTVTWDDVGYYNTKTNKLNAFQLQLIDRGGGDFDFIFRYEAVNWTTGDASSGSNGLGGQVARAGFSAGNQVNYLELTQSGNQGAMLALDETGGNSGRLGTYIYSVRSGNVSQTVGANDTLQGGPGDDTVNGGVGVDTALYTTGSYVNYAVTKSASGYSVSGLEGNDTLVSTERIQFPDRKVAIDLGAGEAAGNTVRIIGAAFDAPAIQQHPEWVGIGLQIFDLGTSFSAVCTQVAQIMGMNNTQFVTQVFTNVMGFGPDPTTLNTFVGFLQGNGGTMTQGQLLEVAATVDINATININLVGLQQTGVEFV